MEITTAFVATRPQQDILDSRQPVNLFLAGQGAGKSHCAGLVTAPYIMNYPKMRGIICANTYGQLTRSTLFRIREVWKNIFGLTEYMDGSGKGNYVIGRQPPKGFVRTGHNFDSYSNIISFDNGAVVYIGSLDNYKALDGIEVCWAVLDETKDTKEDAVKQVIVGRLRQRGLSLSPALVRPFGWHSGQAEAHDDKGEGGVTGCAGGVITEQQVEGGVPFNPLYIFTSPASVPWINEWFYLQDYEREINELIFSETTYFKKEVSNKFVVISSTYHNAPNLPANYISNQKANLHTALQDLLIYGSPFGKSGGEFYKYFDRNKHVGRLSELMPDYFGKGVGVGVSASTGVSNGSVGVSNGSVGVSVGNGVGVGVSNGGSVSNGSVGVGSGNGVGVGVGNGVGVGVGVSVGAGNEGRGGVSNGVGVGVSNGGSVGNGSVGVGNGVGVGVSNGGSVGVSAGNEGHRSNGGSVSVSNGGSVSNGSVSVGNGVGVSVSVGVGAGNEGHRSNGGSVSAGNEGHRSNGGSVGAGNEGHRSNGGSVSAGNEGHRSNREGCPYNPGMPLLISVDENAAPYFPMGIYQMQGLALYKIDEICGEWPNNTVNYICEEFTRRYRGHTAGVSLYGDATSQKDDVKQEKGMHLYYLMRNQLRSFPNVRMMVSQSNPSVTGRGDFINTVLEKEIYGCKFMIDIGCQKSIADYNNTKENADRTKDKKTITDPDTKRSYQPWGHLTDEGDYIMCVVWAAQFRKYMYGEPQPWLYSTSKIDPQVHVRRAMKDYGVRW